MHTDALSILRRNMEAVAREEEACAALHDGTLAELALLCRGGLDAAQAFRAVSDAPFCSAEFARLCRRLCGGVTDPAVLVSMLPEHSADDTPTDTRTAYLRNAYTDRAFAAFARQIDRLSAQYQPSFSAGCEEVYYGRCSYCILPIRNSEDGTLTSFSRMIAKYDLKIARVCDVTTQDGDSTMRYALLRRGLDLRVPAEGILQITLVLPEGISLGRFLLACEATGAAVDCVTTIPLRYTSEIASLNICFRINRENTAPLLCFLTHVLESCTPDGIYSTALS